MGCLLPEQSDAIPAIRDMVYKHWDAADTSPAKVRPKDDKAASVPDLKLLAWQNGPIWPDVLTAHFVAGSEEHNELMKRKAEFDAKYASTTGDSATTTPSGGGRAGGCCDFSIDGGTKPRDLKEAFALTYVLDSAFTESRPVLDKSKSKTIIQRFRPG